MTSFFQTATLLRARPGKMAKNLDRARSPVDDAANKLNVQFANQAAPFEAELARVDDEIETIKEEIRANHAEMSDNHAQMIAKNEERRAQFTELISIIRSINNECVFMYVALLNKWQP